MLSEKLGAHRFFQGRRSGVVGETEGERNEMRRGREKKKAFVKTLPKGLFIMITCLSTPSFMLAVFKLGAGGQTRMLRGMSGNQNHRATTKDTPASDVVSHVSVPDNEP